MIVYLKLGRTRPLNRLYKEIRTTIVIYIGILAHPGTKNHVNQSLRNIYHILKNIIFNHCY